MATSDTGVRIEGLRETVRTLERYGVDVEDLKEAFGAISRDVATEAAGIVPVRTGRLRNSIRPTRTKNRAVVRAGTAAIPYAGVINYGHPRRGIQPTGFLTDPANSNTEAKVAQLEANLEALARKYGLT